MIMDMWEDGWPGRAVLCFLALGILSIPVGVWGAIEDQRQWSAFSAAHACKIVGHMSGDTVTTVAPIIGGNGGIAVGVSSTPSKTGWQCDDGVTYWR